MHLHFQITRKKHPPAPHFSDGADHIADERISGNIPFLKSFARAHARILSKFIFSTCLSGYWARFSTQGQPCWPCSDRSYSVDRGSRRRSGSCPHPDHDPTQSALRLLHSQCGSRSRAVCRYIQERLFWQEATLALVFFVGFFFWLPFENHLWRYSATMQRSRALERR